MVFAIFHIYALCCFLFYPQNYLTFLPNQLLNAILFIDVAAAVVVNLRQVIQYNWDLQWIRYNVFVLPNKKKKIT